MPPPARIGLTVLGWIALFAPLAMVLFLSFRINQMSVGAAQATFWVYAALVGIGIAPILLGLYRRQRRRDVLHHGRDLRRHEPVGLHHPLRSDAVWARSCSWA